MEGAGKLNGSSKKLSVPRITDKKSRTLPCHTETKSSKNEEIEVIELETVKQETASVTVPRGDKPKQSKRHENHDIEVLKDDLRVVVLHPDQETVCGEYIELNGGVHCMEENTVCSVVRHRSGWD